MTLPESRCGCRTTEPRATKPCTLKPRQYVKTSFDKRAPCRIQADTTRGTQQRTTMAIAISPAVFPSLQANTPTAAATGLGTICCSPSAIFRAMHNARSLLTYLVQSSLGGENRDLVVIVRVPRHGATLSGPASLRCALLQRTALLPPLSSR